MKNILLILVLLLSLSACSIFQSSDDEDEKAKADAEEVYVFDEVDNAKKSKDIDDVKKDVDNTFDDDSDDNEKTDIKPTTQHGYYLQLGAFSTKSRAEQYIKENESKVPFKLSIVYNNVNSLYTVRSSAYNTKSEAQMVREGFWKQNMFKDAFIVTE